MRRLLGLALGAIALSLSAQSTLWAQLPLSPVGGAGQTVTPAYEGWYENPDGTFTLSFGYYNRNFEEVLEIPLGAENYIEPPQYNGEQPTRFEPRRHWGVFGIKVPADFGTEARVVWTLSIRGETVSIPGHLDTQWKIDALAGEAGSGNTPPVLRFEPGGPEGQGPAGLMGPHLRTAVGAPLSLNVWAEDDGKADTRVGFAGTPNRPINLTWFKHQGSGDVTFSEDSAEIEYSGGEMLTTATFSEPGDYILRVRANDASGVTGAGHAQCCWTNGFVRVTVTRQ